MRVILTDGTINEFSRSDYLSTENKIIEDVKNENKPFVIVMNKWDLIEKDEDTLKKFNQKLENEFAFMSYFKAVYLSALTGKKVEKLMQTVEQVIENTNRRVTPGVINEILQDAYMLNNPPFKAGKKCEFYSRKVYDKIGEEYFLTLCTNDKFEKFEYVDFRTIYKYK